MTDVVTELERRGATGVTRRRAYLVIGLGYLLLRAVNLVELAVASTAQVATGPANSDGSPGTYFVHTPSGPAPGLAAVLANWDGQWYERIAVEGYAAGSPPSENDAWLWAFPPLFPLVVRALMAVTGLGFPVAAVVLNVALGLTASFLVFELMHRAGARVAVLSALALGAFTASPLFVVAYSEPLALVLLLLGLWLTGRHRYLLAVGCVVLLAFTRPIAAPMAAVFVVHLVMRRRSTDGPRPSGWDHVALLGGSLAALASPYLWPLLASRLQGSVPAQSGVSRATDAVRDFDFGWFGGFARAGLAALVLFVVGVGCVLWLAWVSADRLGAPLELRVWGVTYAVFYLTVTWIHPGAIRYLMLAWPLLACIVVHPFARWRRPLGYAVGIALVGLLLWSQWLWIRYLYILDMAPSALPYAP